MRIAAITCASLPNGVEDDQDLFQEISKLGIEVDVVAWHTDTDWSVYDACLLRSVWDYHEQVEAFTTWLGAVSQVSRLLNHADLVRWNSNKNYLQQLQAFGVTIAPTAWLTQAEDFALHDWINDHPAPQYFLKPVVGADSSGTCRFTADAKGMLAAEQHLATWLPKVDMMLQPYLSSVETFGETSLIYFNGSLSHAVRKIPVNGDFRVQDTFGASDVSYQANGIEMALSKACLEYIADRFEPAVYARLDFLHDDGAVYLNEAELIEPSLFFNHDANAAKRFAAAIQATLIADQSD